MNGIGNERCNSEHVIQDRNTIFPNVLEKIKFDENRLVKYSVTSIEKNYKPILHVDPSLGIQIDLIDQIKYLPGAISTPSKLCFFSFFELKGDKTFLIDNICCFLIHSFYFAKTKFPQHCTIANSKTTKFNASLQPTIKN